MRPSHAPKGLPQNCYDVGWLLSFPDNDEDNVFLFSSTNTFALVSDSDEKDNVISMNLNEPVIIMHDGPIV